MSGTKDPRDGRVATGASPAAPRPSFMLPLLHWFVLVCGLALLTVLRIDELPKMAPLWMGSVLGTALGQLLAYRRMRMWLFAFIVGNLLWLGPLTIAPLWPLLGAQPWASVEVFAMAFAPAAFAGYLSLTERGALVSFWFPAVPWMVTLLDRSNGASVEGPESWLLLGALAVLFLGLLRARESRRTALWQGYAVTRLSRPLGEAVLRQAPLRRAGQLAWMGVVGVVTLALTGFIAPRLWQDDDLEARRGSGANGALGLAGDDDWVCCNDPASSRVEQKKVKEYFPIRNARDASVIASPAASCVACVNGWPAAGTTPVATQVDTPQPVAATPGATAVPLAPTATPPSAPAAATAAPTAAPVAAAPAAPKAPAVRPRVPPSRPPAGYGRWPAYSPYGPDPSRAVVAVPPVMGFDPLALGLALALSGTIVQLVMRPLRRLLVLRHLERPLWAETVDQRVSNLWQMMLIGLRDAGWQTTAGEQPQELARRIGIQGMKTCATVLERARHGVRVDGADLDAMQAAARSVYEAARGQVGVAARAASWLRWPLV